MDAGTRVDVGVNERAADALRDEVPPEQREDEEPPNDGEGDTYGS